MSLNVLYTHEILTLTEAANILYNLKRPRHLSNDKEKQKTTWVFIALLGSSFLQNFTPVRKRMTTPRACPAVTSPTTLRYHM
jgi:hypothetical protein